MSYNGSGCSSTKEYEIELLWYLFAKNHIFATFGERQKALELSTTDIEKGLLAIQILLYVLHNHCPTIAVAVLVW